MCTTLFVMLLLFIFDYIENTSCNNKIKFSYKNLLLLISNTLKSNPKIRIEQEHIIISIGSKYTQQQFKITPFGIFIDVKQYIHNYEYNNLTTILPSTSETRFIYPGFIDSFKFKFLFNKIMKSINHQLTDKLTNSLLNNLNLNYNNLSSDEIVNIIQHYLPNIPSDNNDHSFEENELTDIEPIGFKITKN